MSKRNFKSLVKSSCEKACFKYLLSERSKLSKGKEIEYTKLETQPYLKPGMSLTVDSMRKIYHIRCREVYLKCNYPSAFGDKKCPAPHTEMDQQNHVFNCLYFSKENEIVSSKLIYEDIFKNNVKNQVEIMTVFYARLEVRRSYLPPQQRAPADPSRVPGRRFGIREAKLKYKFNNKKTKQNKKRGLK